MTEEHNVGPPSTPLPPPEQNSPGEQRPVAPATVHKSKLWKIFWPLVQFIHGIAWLKWISDRMGFVPVAFTIVVLWCILRLFDFQFTHSWITAFVVALVCGLGGILEARQCTSTKFNFNKPLWDQFFALGAVTLATAVFMHLFENGRGVVPGDIFIVLLYYVDGEFSPYIYLRTNFRSFVGAGIGGADHDQQTVNVDVDHPHGG